MPFADVIAGAAAAAWLILVLAAWLTSRPWPVRQGSVPPDLRDEPPAVVARLDRQPWTRGYAATMLHLAARGHFGLVPDPADPDRLLARADARPARSGPPAGRKDHLTSYERMALDHVRFRAGPHGSAPASALTGGFRIGDRAFRGRFTAAVRADMRRRGLAGRRIGAGQAGLITGAAAVVAGTGLAGAGTAAGRGAAIIAGIAMALPAGAMYHAERLTGDGRQALAQWLGFRATMAALPGTALQASGGNLRIGYAAALGVAPGALSALTEPADAIWSSYTGTWRQLRVPRPREPFVPGPGALLAGAVLLGAAAIGVVMTAVTRGPLAAAGLAVLPGALLWGTGGWIWLSALRAWRRPGQAEFDGVVLKRWSEVRATARAGGGPPRTPVFYVAIDDGRGIDALALRASRPVYEHCPAGAAVRAVISVRENRLLSVSPARTGDSTSGPPVATPPPRPRSAAG